MALFFANISLFSKKGKVSPQRDAILLFVAENPFVFSPITEIASRPA